MSCLLVYKKTSIIENFQVNISDGIICDENLNLYFLYSSNSVHSVPMKIEKVYCKNYKYYFLTAKKPPSYTIIISKDLFGITLKI